MTAPISTMQVDAITPFAASKLKLNRAAKHFSELEDAVSAYLSESPVRIVVEPFPGMEMRYATRAWVARINNPVPLHLSAIIGDVVHNLRAALDLLACDLVRLAGQTSKGVYFPFCDVPVDLPARIKKCNLHRAGSDVVDVIRRLRPYNGGNIALRAIHDMDIADKHRALLPVIGATTVPIGSILRIPPTYQLQELSTIIRKDAQIIVGLPGYAGTPALGTELPARFFLALHEIPGIGTREIFEALHSFTEAAHDVFDALTALRPGAAFPTNSA
jgi:hypothetical protein